MLGLPERQPLYLVMSELCLQIKQGAEVEILSVSPDETAYINLNPDGFLDDYQVIKQSSKCINCPLYADRCFPLPLEQNGFQVIVPKYSEKTEGNARPVDLKPTFGEIFGVVDP